MFQGELAPYRLPASLLDGAALIQPRLQRSAGLQKIVLRSLRPRRFKAFNISLADTHLSVSELRDGGWGELGGAIR